MNRMMQEMARVLQPGCVLLLISLGGPSKRLPLFQHTMHMWESLEVVLLPKLSQEEQIEAKGQ